MSALPTPEKIIKLSKAVSSVQDYAARKALEELIKAVEQLQRLLLQT